MNPQATNAKPDAAKERVIALHASGSTPAQWQALTDALGWCFDVHALCIEAPMADDSGNAPSDLSIADLAADALALVESSDTAVHLVGHSYGGAIALFLAAQRPEKIASVGVYEPAAFHVLNPVDAAAHSALREAKDFRQQLDTLIAANKLTPAAALFVDFWNGESTWSSLSSNAQASMTRKIERCVIELAACFGTGLPPLTLSELHVPVMVLRGEHAKTCMNSIACTLKNQLPQCATPIVYGAGHMGPMTHTQQVTAYLADFIFDVFDRRAADGYQEAA